MCEQCLDMVRPWSTFGTVMDLAKTAKICDRTKTAKKTRGRTWMYNIPNQNAIVVVKKKWGIRTRRPMACGLQC